MSLTLLALTTLLSLLVGVALGMLGGGGAILTVPILVYVAGVPPKSAMATSALVVAATAAVAAVSHARAGRVRWRVAFAFAAGGVPAAFAGARLAGLLPQEVLLVAFAVLMLVTATAMLRRRDPAKDDEPERPVHVLRLLPLGAAVGSVTGLLGAGGGFLIVPALHLWGGLPMRAAIATSLAVIVANSTASLIGYLGHTPIDPMVAAPVAAAAFAGTLGGTRLSQRVPQRVLRSAFGWFVIAMGVFVLFQRAWAAGWLSLRAGEAWHIAVAMALLAALAGIVIAVTRPPVRRPPPLQEESTP